MERQEENDKESQNITGIPIDRGWAWVILAASWVNCFISIGSYRAFGVLFIEIQDRYGSSSSITSLIASLLNGTYSVTALVVTTVGMKYFSNRQFVVLGSLIIAVAYSLSAFAPTVEVLILSMGCLSGIAHGMLTAPTMALLSQYFERYRSLANCIALTGSSFGALVFSVLIPYWIEKYAFSGTVLLLGGVMLHMAISGLLMRPITTYIKDTTNTDESQKLQEIHHELNEHARNSTERNKVKTELRNGHNIALQLEGKSDSARTALVDAKLSPLTLRIAVARNRRKRTISELSKSSITQKMGSAVSALNMSNIGRYASTELSFSSMLDLNTKTGHEKEGTDTTGKKNCFCFKGACAKCDTFVDCGAIKRLPFLFFIPSGCCIVMVSVISLYLPAYAKDFGIPSKKCSSLITVISITEMCGNIFWGVFADRQYIKRHKILSGAIVTLGVVTYFTPLFETYEIFVVYSVIYGVFGRLYFSLYPVILVDFIGLENLRSALGIVALTQTAVSAALQPIIGLMRDEYKTYYPGMLMIATLLIFGGLFLLTLPFAEKCEKPKKRPELEIHVDDS